MSIEIKHVNPTPAQWMQLRASVGWATFDEATAQRSLDATLFCACAFEGDRLVGMGRVLGDGVFSFYIGNVMVPPDYQGRGVGKLVMRELVRYVDGHAHPGAIASLMSIKGRETFYVQFGFRQRPDDEHGSGMSKYY